MFYCFERLILRKTLVLLICTLLAVSVEINAQNGDTTLHSATLPVLINYALAHQPAVKQASIDQEITDLQIKNS